MIQFMNVKQTYLLQLQDAVIVIWTQIPKECFRHIVESIPDRIKAVLKGKEVHFINNKVMWKRAEYVIQ